MGNPPCFRKGRTGFPRKAGSRKRRRYGRQQRRRRIFGGLALLCLLGVISSACALLKYIRQTGETRNIQAQHIALMNEEETEHPGIPTETIPLDAQDAGAIPPAVTPEPTRHSLQTPIPPKPAVQEKFLQLYAQNRDLVGWLKVNSLYRIDFAVVHGKNSFYIDHDFNQKENINGSAFLDETCSIWPRDDNLIIYAHNMKNGDMFGELNKMLLEETLRADPTVQFDTLYEQDVYIPVAVFVCSVVQAEDYFQFYVRNFRTEREFDSYIEQARQLSGVQLATDVRYGDPLLTLTTCYDRENTKRLVVLLRRLRKDEDVNAVDSIVFS